MDDEPKISELVWADFDALIHDAPTDSPWQDGRYGIDQAMLARLLDVPMRHGAKSESGMLAKALDVWVAHELRRCGFPADEVWPRTTVPRVLPREVGRMRRAKGIITTMRPVFERIDKGDLGQGITSADAKVLGAAYVKQVDVVLASWSTGPEILISTKRMDSSFGNNAANRIEESYGDAKNLRGRHPLAAIGFLFGLRSTGFDVAKDSVLRLVDLLGKMAREKDAYDATGLVVIDYADEPDADGKRPITIRPDLTPPDLDPARFMRTIVEAVLDRTPIDYHVEARARRGQEVPTDSAIIE